MRFLTPVPCHHRMNPGEDGAGSRQHEHHGARLMVRRNCSSKCVHYRERMVKAVVGIVQF